MICKHVVASDLWADDLVSNSMLDAVALPPSPALPKPLGMFRILDCQVIGEDGKDCTPKPLVGRHVDTGAGAMSSFFEGNAGERASGRSSIQISLPGWHSCWRRIPDSSSLKILLLPSAKEECKVGVDERQAVA